jgi:hypothetical protein
MKRPKPIVLRTKLKNRGRYIWGFSVLPKNNNLRSIVFTYIPLIKGFKVKFILFRKKGGFKWKLTQFFSKISMEHKFIF